MEEMSKDEFNLLYDISKYKKMLGIYKVEIKPSGDESYEGALKRERGRLRRLLRFTGE